MKYILNINLGERQETADFCIDPIDNEFMVILYLDSLDDFSKVDNKYISEALKKSEAVDYLEEDDIDIYKSLVSGDVDCLGSCDTIYVGGDYKDIDKFISNNQEIFSRKVVVKNFFDLANSDLGAIKNSISDYNRLRYSVLGDLLDFSFKELELATNRFRSMVDEVAQFNYSPLEIALHLYDLVRDRYYVMGESEYDDASSRGLASVLLSDYIVCAGFVSLYTSLLKTFDIKAKAYELAPTDSENGHVQTIARIKDDKYDIDGVLFFDPTADCRKKSSNNFLNIYRFFAKNFREMSEFTDKYDSVLKGDKALIDEYYEYLDEQDGAKKQERRDILFKKMLFLSTFIDNNALPKFLFSQAIDGDKLYEYSDILDRKVGNTAFMKAFINVRKNEYYLHPEKYPFDMNAFYTGLTYSLFDFDCREQDKLLNDIFGKAARGKRSCIANMVHIAREANLEQDIERVKLARTLRKVLENKKNI